MHNDTSKFYSQCTYVIAFNNRKSRSGTTHSVQFVYIHEYILVGDSIHIQPQTLLYIPKSTQLDEFWINTARLFLNHWFINVH